MAFVAIFTVGMLKHPYDHSASRQFFSVGNDIFRQATKSGYMIDAFSSDGISLPDDANKGDGYPIITLTIWKNLESLYRFTYSGYHKQALKDRNNWMESYKEKHLSYVVWWTEKPSDVSWEEAFKRYDYYIQNGSTSTAFDFKHAFDQNGEVFLIK